jgi:hypothetical protein
VISQIPLLQQSNFEIEQLQKNLALPLNDLFKKNPFLDGVYLKDISLTTGITNAIPHLLKRKYQGYFVTKLNANSVIWVSNSEKPDFFLKLSCSANCVVDLWVF